MNHERQLQRAPKKPNTQPKPNPSDTDLLLAVGGAAALVGLGVFCYQRVFISSAHQYVVRTGVGIKDISIGKVAFRFPLQKAAFISVTPTTFNISVDAMSMQRIPFKLPSVWTIGPDDRNIDALKQYARLMTEGQGEAHQKHVYDTVSGVIQGEVRVLTAGLELNQLFSDRDRFKNEVVSRIDEVIQDFGIRVFNANISELVDLDDQNRFFFEQKQRALQKESNSARVHVAQAIREGEIGEEMARAEARQGTAQARTSAEIFENQRLRDVAESLRDLNVARVDFERAQKVAKVEADAAAALRKWELEQMVEQERAKQTTQELRANLFSRADVEAQVAEREAEGQARAVRLRAEAELFRMQNEAAGVLAMREAEAEGLRRLVEAAGGVDGLNKFKLVEKLPQLAQSQADALQGLKPQVSIWNTGASGAQTGNALSSTVNDLFRTSMPLFANIKEQTGYDFLGSLGVKKDEKGVKQDEKQS